MRYIFYCPNCNFTGSDIESKAYNPSKCPECKHILKYTGLPLDEWKSKSQKEKELWKNKWNEDSLRLNPKSNLNQEDMVNLRFDHMLTSGYNFEGYKINSYNGIVSGEVVLGTGFLSEFSASINDFFGSTSEEFSMKMKQAKDIATSKMIDTSIVKGGNAIIGVDFDYTTFGNNMIAVSANGTSVVIEKLYDSRKI